VISAHTPKSASVDRIAGRGQLSETPKTEITPRDLRAAMSLARLEQMERKRGKAHDLLAGVYGWFTGGFDTQDLQEARSLLG
jgi:predicted ATPase